MDIKMNEKLQHRLKHLETDHAEINRRIDGMESTGVFEDVTLEVLKKQRLHLKDEIAKIKLQIAYELGAQEND
jgi:uncharacterized protein YdcH (DUF465 family)